MDRQRAYTFLPDKNHSEGFGSIFQSELFAFMYAKSKNRPFFRSEFKLYNGHAMNKNTREEEQYIFFNFLTSKKDRSEYDLINIKFTDSYSYLTSLTLIEIKSLIDLVRRKYYASRLNKNYKVSNEINIALHLRNISSGDVIFSLDSLPWQYFNYDYGLKNNNPLFYANFYSEIVNMIIRQLPSDKKVITTIYSIGDSIDFDQIKKKINSPVLLKLNNHVLDDFIELINSDYLVLAQSSLSYLASFLHTSPKFIREGFRHFTTYDTIIVNDNIVSEYSNLDRFIDKMKLKYFYLNDRITKKFNS